MRNVFLKVLSMLALMMMCVAEAMSGPVDTNTAKLVAKNFLQKHDPTVKNISDLRISDVARSNGLSNIYIVERTDKASFVVVSADDCVQPVLAYSTTSAAANEIPVNAMDWFRGYDGEIAYCVANNVQATEKVAEAWSSLKQEATHGDSQLRANGILDVPMNTQSSGTAVVGPLLTTTWNQAPLYNDYCPYDTVNNERTVVGCVATAMAQIMKYWNYPERGMGSNSYNTSAYGNLSANFANTTYDWTNMPNALYMSSSAAQISAVATLSYHCGVAVNMQYNVSSLGGSSAYLDGGSPSAEYALKTYFAYKNTLSSVSRSNYTDVQWNAMLQSELNAGRPLLYGGTGNGGGHAFVCDGYDNIGLFHYNWGWGGIYNGFFASNNLAPGGGGIGSNQSNTYNNSQVAIIGIEPNNDNLVVRPHSMTFLPIGGNQTLLIRPAVSDTSSWRATTIYPWIILSSNAGMGGGTFANITVTVLPNTSGYNRSGEITVVQHNDTVKVPVTQGYGTNSISGQYGNTDVNYFSAADSGLFIGIRPEKFGNFNPGDTVKSIYYRTYDNTTNYSNYMDSNFVIKIYENPTVTTNMAQGIRDSISNVLGTLVYTQNFRQSYPGNQEVTLTTPYVINSNTFWITLSSAGRTQFLYKVDYKDSVLRSNYPNPSLVEGKYFVGSWNASWIRAALYNAVANDNRYIYQYDCLWVLGFNVSTGSKTVITARPDTASHGFVLGDGAYNMGDTVTLTASALPGYSFARWNDSITTPTRTFVIQPNTYYPDFVAHYTAKTAYILTLTSNNNQYGTTMGSGTYYAGDTAVAVAIPADSTKSFSRWNDNNTSNPRRMVMNANTQLVATFVARNPVTGHDTVRDTIHDTAYVNVYVHDTVHDTSYVNVTSHDTAYVNVYVHDTVHDTSYVNVTTHDTIYINVAVHDTIHDTAFVNLPQHNFNIVSDNSAQGVTVGTGTYPQGLRVGIAAVPNEGYRFSHWSDNNTDNPRHFTVSGDVSLTAYFVTSTGINTPDKNFSLEIYPNPTMGFITLSQYAEKVEILDNVGRLVNTVEGVINLDLSGLADGTYTLRITSQGNVVIKKVVKR